MEGRPSVLGLSLPSLDWFVVKLEADVFRREFRYVCFCVGLVFVIARLLEVAEAGSLGGGILLYLAPASTPGFSRVFEMLRRRVRLNLRRIAEAEKEDSVSLEEGFSSCLLLYEKLGALGPLGFA
jgi:hypothetical protein